MSRLPSDIAARWHAGTVLKRDLFSTVERGRLKTPDGMVEGVLRRTDQVPWWSWPLARLLLWRERRALAVVGPLGLGPRLLMAGRGYLVRSWTGGAALHLDHPVNDAVYFASAKRLLRRLHRAGVCHNDLAKRPNWLRGIDGEAYLVDFQLATTFRHRHKLYRIAAYEDLRHLLKYKQQFAPALLTATERRIVARKSLPARLWMATGKPVYMFVTRRIFHFVDREGGGPRLVHEAPKLTALIKSHAQVRDVAILAFPDKDKGVGLHAFVETAADLKAHELRALVVDNGGPAPPERLQLVAQLPRDPAGAVRTQILQLLALDQADQIDRLIASDAERAIVASLIAGHVAAGHLSG